MILRDAVLHCRDVLPDTDAGSSGSVLETLLCRSRAIILLTAARGSVLGNSASRLANTARTMEMMIQPAEVHAGVSVTDLASYSVTWGDITDNKCLELSQKKCVWLVSPACFCAK
jgi:hypothetical protein